jgi:hypothetical protein
MDLESTGNADSKFYSKYFAAYKYARHKSARPKSAKPMRPTTHAFRPNSAIQEKIRRPTSAFQKQLQEARSNSAHKKDTKFEESQILVASSEYTINHAGFLT